jgi:hypothetical protein
VPSVFVTSITRTKWRRSLESMVSKAPQCVPGSTLCASRSRQQLPEAYRDLIRGFLGSSVHFLIELTGHAHILHHLDAQRLPDVVDRGSPSSDWYEELCHASITTCISWSGKLGIWTRIGDIGKQIWTSPTQTLATLWRTRKDRTQQDQAHWTTVFRTLCAVFSERRMDSPGKTIDELSVRFNWCKKPLSLSAARCQTHGRS